MAFSEVFENVTSTIFYVLFLVVTPYGIYHSFDKHSTGFLALLVPPYAWYRAVEGVFWHDDYAGIDWEKRIEGDIKTTVALLNNSYDLDAERQSDYNRAVEGFSDEIQRYPIEKFTRLNNFGILYLNYIESLQIDLSAVFGDALNGNQVPPTIQSHRTLQLEQEMDKYPGVDQMISEIKLGLYGLDSMMRDLNDTSVPYAEREKLVEMVSLQTQNNFNRMKSVYSRIFN